MKKALVELKPDVSYEGGARHYTYPYMENADLNTLQVPMVAHRVEESPNDSSALSMVEPIEQLRMVFGEDDVMDQFLADYRVTRVSMDNIDDYAPGGAKNWSPSGFTGPRVVSPDKWREVWSSFDMPEA